MLLCLEGADRVGKSSNARLLVEKLQKCPGFEKIPVEYMAFPDRREELLTGKCIKDFLQRPAESARATDTKDSDQHRAVHLLFSANRFEKAAYIRKRLQEGCIVILDRYILSGLVYSTAKGLDPKWCARSDHGLPWPDVTFYLTLDAETAAKRPGFGSEAFESTYFQQLVAEQYDKMIGFLRTTAYTEPTKNYIGDIITVKIGHESIEQINKQLLGYIVMKHMNLKGKQPYVEHPFTIDF